MKKIDCDDWVLTQLHFVTRKNGFKKMNSKAKNGLKTNAQNDELMNKSSSDVEINAFLAFFVHFITSLIFNKTKHSK